MWVYVVTMFYDDKELGTVRAFRSRQDAKDFIVYSVLEMNKANNNRSKMLYESDIDLDEDWYRDKDEEILFEITKTKMD